MARASKQDPATMLGEESRLRGNALGLWGLVIMGIAYMGLALTAYFNFGIMVGIRQTGRLGRPHAFVETDASPDQVVPG